MIRSAAMAIDCKPEEQNRLIVIAEISTGSPARSAALRATFMPCFRLRHRAAHDDVFDFLRVEPRHAANRFLMAMAARSSGRVVRSVPLKAFPTGVRTELTMTASLMMCPGGTNWLALNPRSGRRVTSDW